MAKTRVCSRCGRRKPLDKFIVRKEKPDGRGYHCRVCDNERKRDKHRVSPRPSRSRSRRAAITTTEIVQAIKAKGVPQ